MQYHLIKVFCTFPIVLYVTLVDLNPYYMDFIYMVNVILCVILTLCFITLENRLFIKIAKSGRNSRAYSFQSEKVVYILNTALVAITFFVCMGYAGNFYKLAHTDGAAPTEVQLSFKMIFFIKLVETVINVVFYVLDEVQTYSDGQQVWPDKSFMEKTSNVRFIVFTLTEFVITGTLVLQFYVNASQKDTFVS
eukprot:265635-Rhodomonas_salina.1